MNRSLLQCSMRACLFVATLFITATYAFALPTNVAVTPPNGARFLLGQKFDLRVEGKGTGAFSATLSIDGTTQNFTSGVQNANTTDNISSPGFGGFNLRGYFNNSPGTHTITASFTDSTGTVNITAQFEIIDVRGALRPARNIIILLGDGMGVAHRTAARIVRYGVTAGHPNGFLAMDQLPGTGLITTHSLNTIITDSAPGMAGYSTGNHSNNNQEGVYPANVTNAFYAPRVEYMAEYLHRMMGKSLGLVTTADVEDATPAANAVHTLNRNAGTGIVDQYLDESDAGNSRGFGTGLSVLMGGGRRWFLPAGQFGSSRSASTDYAGLPADLMSRWNLPVAAMGASDPNRNLLQDFTSSGFTYVDTLTALNSAGTTPTKLLGLFGYGNMNVALDKLAKRRGTMLPGAPTFAVDDYRAPDQPMLDEMTNAALPVLNKNSNGFVLMVEGALIDKQSHAMDADRVIDETIEFDNAVAAARRFADQAGDTMIIVLADHECAGFSLIGALTGGINNLKALPSDSGVTDPNTQPARQKVVGTYDAAGFPKYNILADGYPQTFDIDNKILVGYGASGDRFEGWLQKPLPVIDSLLPSDLKAELASKNYPAEPFQRDEKNSGFFIRGQAVGQTQAVHTASDIPVSAYSSGSLAYQQFYGVQENTDVFFKLMRAASGGYAAAMPSPSPTPTPSPTPNPSPSPVPSPSPTPSPAPANPIDDPAYFVQQQYRDFLGREPDAGGQNYWTGQITQCGADAACVNRKRVDVSAAFFFSQEYQDTGFFIERTYKVAFGNPPAFNQFNSDRGRLTPGANLEASKTSYINDFITRADFTSRYPATQTPAQYVDALNANAGNVLSQTERDALVSGLSSGAETRATVLRKVSDNALFRQREINPAFVLMEYFGYLRRDPDASGYQFWLDALNRTGNFRSMVCAFITSTEYQLRFGNVITRSNADCNAVNTQASGATGTDLPEWK